MEKQLKHDHKHKACQKSINEVGYKLKACCQCRGHRCHRINRKDLIKVIAGHLGGKVSGGNFANNKQHARNAGIKSAFARSNITNLADYPLFYLDHNGVEVAPVGGVNND